MWTQKFNNNNNYADNDYMVNNDVNIMDDGAESP